MVKFRKEGCTSDIELEDEKIEYICSIHLLFEMGMDMSELRKLKEVEGNPLQVKCGVDNLKMSDYKIKPDDPEFYKILDVINETFSLTTQLNQLDYRDKKVGGLIKKYLIKICMIQQLCTFFDRDGITIGDDVFIAPEVNLVTLNHDLNLESRSITIGRNAVVGAGSVVKKDVEPNTIVGGNLVRFLKRID